MLPLLGVSSPTEAAVIMLTLAGLVLDAINPHMPAH